MTTNKRTNVSAMKPLKDLTMLDYFLFAQAMEDPVISQYILQIILNKDIHLLDKTETEKEFRISPLARSIRVDVYSLDDKDSVYDTEVQKRNTGNLPRRSRFYQAVMDSSLLSPGVSDFNDMKDSCLIVISPFDLWGQGRYRYTFRYLCEEDTSLALEDGTTRIFLNTHGRDSSGISDELVELLHYLEYSTGNSPYPVSSPRIQEIHRHVETVRSSEEMGVKFMQQWAIRMTDRQDGRKEGVLLQLITQMQKKCQRGQSLDDIAEVLEEDTETLLPFYSVIQEHPEYDAEEVLYSVVDIEFD